MKSNFLKRGIVLVAAMAMLTTTLTACGGKDEPTKDADKGGDSNKSSWDKVLTVSVGPEPQTIDPTMNTAVDGGTYINHAFEGLMKINDKNEVVAGVAKEYKVSDDNLVYTFTLRDDAKWSDGQPVKAEDFVYSWQRLVDPKTASDYNYMIDVVKNANEIMTNKADKKELGVKAIDDKTFEVTLATAVPYFIEICAFPATYPLRKDIVEGNEDTWATSPEKYVGNGAYVLKSWTHQSEMVFEKNANYYDAANVKADKINFKLMEDANTILSSFKNEEILFGDDCPTEEIESMKDKGLVVAPQLGTYFICFNMEDPAFKDARVRRALSLVIDRQHIIDNVAKGGQKPADTYVSEGLSDVKMDEQFHDKAEPWYSVKSEDYEKNVEEAKKLMEEAGFKDGEGFPSVDFKVNSEGGHQQIAEAITYSWKQELGVNATISSETWAVFIDTRKKGDYQIARHGWLADYNDPISFLDMWVTGGGNNDAKYSNKEYDDLIHKVKESTDREERIKLMHEAETILGKDMPIIPLYFYTDAYLKSDKLDGFYVSPLGFKYFMYTTVK